MGFLHHSPDPPFEHEHTNEYAPEREARLTLENHHLRTLVGDLRRDNHHLRDQLGHLNQTLDHIMDNYARKAKPKN